MATVYSTMPDIQLSVAAINTLSNFVSPDVIGKAVVNVANYLTKGEQPIFENSIDESAFKSLLDEAQKKAEKWNNQTKKFRENNPRKDMSIQSNEEFDVETGEVITSSTETQNKAQIGPYKEKDEEVIDNSVKVAEMAPKVAKNEDNEIREEELAEQIVNERLEDLQNYEIGEYENNIRNIMNDYCEGETYMFKNNLFKEIRNKLKECV